MENGGECDLEPGDYHVYLVKDATVEDEMFGWQGETSRHDSSNTPLYVEYDGKNITVKVDQAKIYSIYTSGSTVDLSFSYSGGIAQMPLEFRD